MIGKAETNLSKVYHAQICKGNTWLEEGLDRRLLHDIESQRESISPRRMPVLDLRCIIVHSSVFPCARASRLLNHSLYIIHCHRTINKVLAPGALALSSSAITLLPDFENQIGDSCCFDQRPALPQSYFVLIN